MDNGIATLRQLCKLLLFCSIVSAMACSTIDPTEQHRIAREQYIAANQQRWDEEKKSSELAKQEAEKKEQKQKQIEVENKKREESERWTKIIGKKIIGECNGKFFYLQDLLSENPYDVGERCYFMGTFEASNIQILSRTTALMMYREKVVFADFGEASAPVLGQIRSYIVKGDQNPFRYASSGGSTVIAIKVHILKELSEANLTQ